MTEHSGVGEELTLPGDGTWNDEITSFDAWSNIDDELVSSSWW